MKALNEKREEKSTVMKDKLKEKQERLIELEKKNNLERKLIIKKLEKIKALLSRLINKTETKNINHELIKYFFKYRFITNLLGKQTNPVEGTKEIKITEEMYINYIKEKYLKSNKLEHITIRNRMKKLLNKKTMIIKKSRKKKNLFQREEEDDQLKEKSKNRKKKKKRNKMKTKKKKNKKKLNL